ncbi:MAG: isochorismatase hydrolase [Lacunisphaera sp.]|nr:isochorismatase hydrolase [Lacunisphaera sp.]MDB6166621.1 isochorismatase hydrolase [Lacunisphaera sp.]
MTPALPLLLCVDLQPAFLAAIPDSQRVHRRCCFALEVAKGLGLSVVFTEQVPLKLGSTAGDLLALAPKAAVFSKDTFSALGDKALVAHLKAGGSKRILICGIETPVCVYQTARDAMLAGCEVTLLADCLGARRSDDAETVLAQLRHAGCTVLPAETVFYSLLGDAMHPFFRDYTKLVKKYG